MQLPLDPEDIGGVTSLAILLQSTGIKDPRYDPYRLDLGGGSATKFSGRCLPSISHRKRNRNDEI